MMKIARTIGWSFGIVLTIIIVGLLLTYWWISTKWSDFYSENEMKVMAFTIINSPTLPENFYEAYDIIYPNQRNMTLYEMSISSIWSVLTNDNEMRSSRQCNCIISSRFFNNKVPANYHSWTKYIIAHGLEKYSSEQKCLDYYYFKIGVHDISNKYFDKPIDSLTKEECVELILRLKNPILR